MAGCEPCGGEKRGAESDRDAEEARGAAPELQEEYLQHVAGCDRTPSFPSCPAFTPLHAFLWITSLTPIPPHRGAGRLWDEWARHDERAGHARQPPGLPSLPPSPFSRPLSPSLLCPFPPLLTLSLTPLPSPSHPLPPLPSPFSLSLSLLSSLSLHLSSSHTSLFSPHHPPKPPSYLLTLTFRVRSLQPMDSFSSTLTSPAIDAFGRGAGPTGVPTPYFNGGDP